MEPKVLLLFKRGRPFQAEMEDGYSIKAINRGGYIFEKSIRGRRFTAVKLSKEFKSVVAFKADYPVIYTMLNNALLSSGGKFSMLEKGTLQ